jgi:hypothetical protein
MSCPNVNAPILVLLVWIVFPKNSNIWDTEADFKLRAN